MVERRVMELGVATRICPPTKPCGTDDITRSSSERNYPIGTSTQHSTTPGHTRAHHSTTTRLNRPGPNQYTTLIKTNQLNTK